MFFISAVLDVSAHDQITRKNERFYELCRGFRSLPAVRVIEDSDAENEDEDSLERQSKRPRMDD
jgi:hypothetical protein